VFPEPADADDDEEEDAEEDDDVLAPFAADAA
jgi:hypothetical protein